jgi:protein SCO1/2
MWTGIGLLFMAVAGMLYVVLAPLVQPLPTYMALPNVVLTDQDGQPFDLNQTRGKVVVLSPIYTHCPDICPVTTAKMKLLQGLIQTAGLSDQVQLITFTVDPERDNPEVLKRFAGIFNADSHNWAFLTGTPEQIQIMIKGLSLYVQRVYYIDKTPIPETSLTHPTSGTFYLVNHTDILFLVDRQGNVRALPPGSRSNVDDTLQIIRQIVRQ